ncbi:TPA: hypothetical protein PNO53_004140 [Salmonella enterica]|nr:hypothetical protein [Salmonella enterica]
MKVATRQKQNFIGLYEAELIVRVIAIKAPSGRWRLFGLHRNGEAAIYVEKARGGIREWTSLDFLADFCHAAEIPLWEVHNK